MRECNCCDAHRCCISLHRHFNMLTLTCRRCICTGFAQMGSLVCDWLTLTDAHSQRSEHQQATPPPDLSAAHFLRVEFYALAATS